MCCKASWNGTTVLQQTYSIHACIHRTGMIFAYLHQHPPLPRCWSILVILTSAKVKYICQSHFSLVFVVLFVLLCKSSLSNSVMSVFVWEFCWHLQSEKDFGNESTRQNWFNISALLLIHSFQAKVLTTMKGGNVLHLLHVTFLFGVYWICFYFNVL